MIYLTLIVFFFISYLLKNKRIIILIILNFSFLFFFFLVKNFFLFFFFFELSVFPILILILFWGYQIERLQAASFIFFYTLLFSIPALLSIIITKNFSLRFCSLNLTILNNFYIFFLKIIIIVKIPFFFFHVWLPKAHLEAPTIGSIILAAILLKLGCFGFLKINLLSNLKIINNFFFFFSLIGRIFLSLVCFFQRDLKRLIAYSRVVHINLIILGIITFTNYRFFFSVIMMIAHGFISRLLFLKAGNFYINFKTRKIYFINLRNSKNFFILIFILIFIFNFNPPPSLGCSREFFFFLIIFKKNFFYIVFLIIFGLVRSFFCIYIILLVTSNKKEYFFNLNLNNIEKIIFIKILPFSLIFFFFVY